MRVHRTGFTLFELILVLVILVVVAAVAYPSLDAMYGNFRVTAAADMVRGAWAQARAQAMNEGRLYRFSVIPNTGFFRLAPDSPDFWKGQNGTPASNDSKSKPLIQEESLPKGVRFSPSSSSSDASFRNGDLAGSPVASSDSGAWSTIVTFLPDGTAREDVELVFQAKGAKPVTMRLRGLTGAVTTKGLGGTVGGSRTPSR